MNDGDLITAVRQSVTDIHTATPVEQIVRRGRAVRARRWIPRLAGVLAAAAGIAVAVIMLIPASHQSAPQPSVHGAAWTVAKQVGGTIYVTIRQLRDPAGLQAKLCADGVPANVVFFQHSFAVTTSPSAIPRPCRAPHMSNKANALLQNKIMPDPGSFGLGPNSVVLVIRPSAIPSGIGLSIEAFAASQGATGNVFDMATNLVQASPSCTGS